MIHTIQFQSDGHTHIYRFRPDCLGEVRLRLCILAKRNYITWDAVDVNRQLLALKDSTMNEIEELCNQLVARGFYAQFVRLPEGWNCTLNTSAAWRPPSGLGKTQMEALVSAMSDLADVNKQKAMKA